jgi:hypothetical protein
MHFREHRGTRGDSLRTLVELEDRKALVEHCRRILARYDFTFNPAALRVTLYYDLPDPRIGWKSTYKVEVRGYGLVGFTDEPC